MKNRLAFSSLPLLALFLALCSTALASTAWYVDGVHGSDNNDCKSRQHACKTIGHAISLASSGDSVRVAPATYAENLTIGISLRVIGSGASTTIIDGGGISRVVAISNASALVTLSKVTVRNRKQFLGGGISNSGTLTINNSTISQNSTMGRFPSGGGIYNAGTLTIMNSTISGNSARGVGPVVARGGGIYKAGTLTLNNSTLSGNSATNCHDVGEGGGIYGNVTLQNSIVANSPYGGNCSSTMTSKGYNLSSDNTCNFNGTGDLTDLLYQVEC